MKTCFKCGIEKPLSDFYAHPRMADGRVNKCKECNKKDVRENRKKNIDYYRSYDKQRANNPERVSGREMYAKTDAGIKSHSAAKLKWSISNKIKRAAAHMVNNHVRDGKLTKSSVCESCGKLKKRIEGHHCDYAKPLEVIWLCSACHKEWHKNNTAINGD